VDISIYAMRGKEVEGINIKEAEKY